MRYTQYTQDELKEMSLSDLKKVDIYTSEEEQHIQVLMNIQMEKFPSMAAIVPKVFPHSITDGIKTLEQEQVLQKEMDDYNETMKRNFMGELEEEPEEIISEEESEEERAAGEEVESTLDKAIAFCQFCDSKGGRHKKECTREMVTA